EDRAPLCAAEDEEDGEAGRSGGRGGEETGRAPEERGAGALMADTILVIVEQREGKLNRVSWETVAAAQAIAVATGWTIEAAVAGHNIGEIAKEVATKKLGKVYAVESPQLAPYTPDGYAAMLKEFITQRAPKLVL